MRNAPRSPSPAGWAVRDVGVGPAGEGAGVRAGRLFRGAAPSRASGKSVRTFGLSTCVDLRSPDERARDGRLWLGTGVRVVLAPMPRDRRPGVSSPRLADLYDWTLRTHGAAFAVALIALARPHAFPALICCSAGRDRTGMAIALVLDIVGVIDAAIVEDYLLAGDSASPPRRESIVGFLDLVRERYGSGEAYARAHSVPAAAVDAIRSELVMAPQ